jgi:hypothetical protein
MTEAFLEKMIEKEAGPTLHAVQARNAAAARAKHAACA